MKNTLIVNYTPREGSTTKKLVDKFIEFNKDRTNITFLDLAKNTPDLLLEENLNLYVNRNFGGVELTAEQSKVLAKNDNFAAQILSADFIVIATPMYNMSLPATVKAWIDAITQVGKTFAFTAEGMKGLCENTQGLVLMTSGSDFSIEPFKSMNHATPLLNACLGLVGVPTENITVFGTQQYADKVEGLIENAKQEIETVSSKWY